MDQSELLGGCSSVPEFVLRRLSATPSATKQGGAESMKARIVGEASIDKDHRMLAGPYVLKGTNSPIGPLSWRSSASSSIICHAPPPVLSHHVQGPRPAETPPADTFGKGHRADGAPPRGPGAEASAPWSRSLPDHGPSDPRGPQSTSSKVALGLFSRHARDSSPLAPGRPPFSRESCELFHTSAVEAKVPIVRAEWVFRPPPVEGKVPTFGALSRAGWKQFHEELLFAVEVGVQGSD